MQLQKTFNRALVGTGALVLAGASHAAAINVSDIVTDIAAQAAPVALIGGAVLLLVVGIKAFQWVRKALS